MCDHFTQYFSNKAHECFKPNVNVSFVKYIQSWLNIFVLLGTDVDVRFSNCIQSILKRVNRFMPVKVRSIDTLKEMVKHNVTQIPVSVVRELLPYFKHWYGHLCHLHYV